MMLAGVRCAFIPLCDRVMSIPLPRPEIDAAPRAGTAVNDKADGRVVGAVDGHTRAPKRDFGWATACKGVGQVLLEGRSSHLIDELTVRDLQSFSGNSVVEKLVLSSTVS